MNKAYPREISTIGLRTLLIIAAILFLLPADVKAQCSPFMGIGNVQFLDNAGAPLTAGALYSYQAGTSTQQATYSDSACTVLNINPITFGSGGRAAIWLTTGNTYKFVLCSVSTDGAACAAGHILFSIDSVPGGSSGGGGVATAPFITSSANPATTGVLRCASADPCVAFRNQANSGNLTITKDTADLLTFWGNEKQPEIGAPTSVVGFDISYADSTAHRFKNCNNGGACAQTVLAGNDIDNTDAVTAWHFGAAKTPLSATAPATNQCLQWTGTVFAGVACGQGVWSTGWAAVTLAPGTSVCALTGSTGGFCQRTIFATAHTLIRFTAELTNSPAGCTTQPVIGVKDLTSGVVLNSITIANGASVGLLDSGAISVAITTGDTIGIGQLTTSVGCTANGQVASLTAIMQ